MCTQYETERLKECFFTIIQNNEKYKVFSVKRLKRVMKRMLWSTFKTCYGNLSQIKYGALFLFFKEACFCSTDVIHMSLKKFSPVCRSMKFKTRDAYIPTKVFLFASKDNLC